MLCDTDRPLPPEIYQVVCSYLSHRDLARLSRTCHALFGLTVPYLWQSATLKELLRLIQSCTPRDTKTDKAQSTPRGSPDDYFARFDLYAKWIKVLRCDTLQGFPDNNAQRAAQTWISDYVSERVLLPRLKRAMVLICMPQDENLQRDYRFWIDLFVSDTLEELMLWTNNMNDEEIRFLQSILLRSPALARLDLNPYSGRSIDSWNFAESSITPPTLQELSLMTQVLNERNIMWMSQMQQLRSLQLLIHTMWCPGGFSVALTGEHQYRSFETLEKLSIHLSVEGWPALKEIWRTPIVTHIVRLDVKAYNLGFDPRSATHFLTTLAASSSKIQHLSLIEDEGFIMNPETPNFPGSLLALLRSLPLRTLKISRSITPESGCSVFGTIGNLWPGMEELSLWTTVELRELLEVSTHLPNLRQLQVFASSTKPTPESLSSALEKTTVVLPGFSTSHLTLNLFFNLRRSDKQERFNCDLADWDCLARMLVFCCRKVCVPLPFGYRKYMEHEEYFLERVNHHSDERTRGSRGL